jgi:hypothetical protein
MSKLAYVIGNSEYKYWESLKNPINDALGISEALTSVGFQVKWFRNLDYSGLSQSIYEFGHELNNFRVGLFYFAGHGMELDGENYLIPIDAQIQTPGLIASSSVRLSFLLDWMSNYKENTNIIILDACRTNISFKDSRGLITTGLLPISAPKGTFISYSTSPGSNARDGKRDNSLFTEALIHYLPSEGLKIEDVFKNVRFYVQETTNGEQLPWELSALIGDFYFVEPRHSFSSEVTPQIIYDYAESIWDEYEKQNNSDKAEALVFIDVSKHFNIPILEVYRGYSIIQDKHNFNFSDAQLCVLGLERLKGIGFKEENNRWYYDGNPVRMGEILPLPPDLEFMVPEEGCAIIVDIKVNESFEDEKLIFHGICNLPAGMLLMLSLKSTENKYFAQDKVNVENGGVFISGFTNKGRKISIGEYKLEISSPIFSVQPNSIKPSLGNRCRNLSGRNVEFNIIGGNTIQFTYKVVIDY